MSVLYIPFWYWNILTAVLRVSKHIFDVLHPELKYVNYTIKTRVCSFDTTSGGKGGGGMSTLMFARAD